MWGVAVVVVVVVVITSYNKYGCVYVTNIYIYIYNIYQHFCIYCIYMYTSNHIMSILHIKSILYQLITKVFNYNRIII